VNEFYSHLVRVPRLDRLATQRWVDILIATGLFGWAAPDVSWWWRPPGHVPSTPVVFGYLTLALAMSVPFLWRRRYPTVVLLVAVGVFLTRWSLSVDVTAAFVAVLVAAYGVAAYSVRGRRYARWLGWLCLPVAVVITAASNNGDRMNGAPVAMLGAALLVGDAAMARRNEIAAAVEAAHLAERARIARELHDVLAHQLSAIAVQAGATRMAGPDGAAATLATIERLTREALGGLNQLLGMLRTDAGDDPARQPAPTLADLDALLAATRAAGITVDLAVDGPAQDLSPGLQLCPGGRDHRPTRWSRRCRHARAGRAVRRQPARVRAARRRIRGDRHAALRRPRDPVNAASPITVLVADDQALVRAGLVSLLGSQPEFVVVGQAEDGAHAVTLSRALIPDVVLMDIRMPFMDGLEATRRIVAESPCRVVILTTYDLDEYVYDALRAGACGFLLKHAPPEELILGVRAASNGGALLSPTITKRLIETFAARPGIRRQTGPARPAHPTRARSVRPAGDRTHEHRDRPRPRHRRNHSKDARQSRPRQARTQRPGARSRIRLRESARRTGHVIRTRRAVAMPTVGPDGEDGTPTFGQRRPLSGPWSGDGCVRSGTGRRCPCRALVEHVTFCGVVNTVAALAPRALRGLGSERDLARIAVVFDGTGTGL
jgi:DNA-binding NarL/FixJ family response regulator/signal transduction histidine kinase